MDNGTLVFIIHMEAMVIAWQASKLKQFHKFEKILGTRAPAADNASEQVAASAATAIPVTTKPESSPANSASRAVASALSADDIDEQILDSASADPESNIEEAKRVQLVMARCRYAEFYLEQLDDDYERDQFERIINSCKSTARNIQDPFFRASALQSVILLLNRAEWNSERDELLAEVDDRLMRERIAEELAAEVEA